jgi:MYXO-CTERM domain-containing protein
MEASSNRRAGACVLLLALAGCLAELPTAEGPEPPAPGAVRGELVLYTLSFDDGTSEEQYFLRVGGRGGDEGLERRLYLSREPELPAGSLIDVWGAPIGDGLEVSRLEPVRTRDDGLEQVARKLIGAPPQRARSFAFVLVDVGGGVNLTVEEANRRLFSNMPMMGNASVRQYFNEASYGRQDVAGQVFGPFQYTMTGCSTRPLANALKPMIPGTFDHYLWYMGSRVMACGWTGLASGGTAARPSKDTWYNASAGCGVLIQEPGHNFGMRHSAGMTCMDGAVPFLDVPQDVCVHSEYGDSFDPMGRGGCKHMNSFQKTYVGWLGKCNMAEVTTSGTYTLLPIELPCNGIQSLQVPMAKARPFFRSGGGGSAGITELTHYYLELRAPHGIDRQLQPQVQVRVSNDTRMANQRPTHTWFLDMAPAMGQQGLLTGGSYTDPAGGITFTVESLDAKQATVRIEIAGSTPGGPARCLDESTVMAPGPGPESCSAGPFSINGAPPPSTTDGGAPPAPPPGSEGGGPGPTGPAVPPPMSPTAPPGAPSPGAPPPAAPGEPPTMVEPIPAGCDCRLGTSGNQGTPLALALAIAGLLAVRRRRS